MNERTNELLVMSVTADHLDKMLADFRRDRKDGKRPWTTPQIAHLLIKTGERTTGGADGFVSMIAATAIQRLLEP